MPGTDLLAPGTVLALARDAGNPRPDTWPRDYDPYAILRCPSANYPEHVTVAAINIRCAVLGENWARCCHCGDRYRVTPGRSDVVCSDSCADAYAAYVTREAAGP